LVELHGFEAVGGGGVGAAEGAEEVEEDFEVDGVVVDDEDVVFGRGWEDGRGCFGVLSG